MVLTLCLRLFLPSHIPPILIKAPRPVIRNELSAVAQRIAPAYFQDLMYSFS